MVILMVIIFTVSAGATSYQAIPGDSLWKIAKSYNVSVEQLKAVNNLNTNQILVGQVLNIPDTAKPAVHKVQPGDTLWILAQRYNVSVEQLKTANNLKSNEIMVGQALTIPGGMVNLAIHRVQAGDTLFNIAQRYGSNVSSIMSLNQLTSTLIYPGQVLNIPGPSQAGSPSGSQESGSNTLTQQGVVYTVKSGDTLSTLANRFNTNIQAIMQTNRLNSQLLMVGQLLVIPQNSQTAVDMQVPSRQRIANFGEYLEWPYASMLFNVGATATITDVATGLKFRVKRLGGGNHADVEPLTSQDTETLRRIYGGSWSWNTRAILVEVGGRYIAASMNGMPHSIQTIYNNNFNGHICVHFLNSRTHNTNSVCPNHAAMVRRAAGR
ncbi:LysM peptidoglycan-binding domain-containing protein [Candidatus Contubernalis alkaliaceticus]|uniref:LysM peptidoglycan-binding domain-containing protein n=1 Tax=Candidatus Contubernalis alkaliaceticus TaxID=338645 RepID=UPI001F4C1A8D|nr:LysM peptidoglycan-binding domain-containing protein [Candidatus Contubernalis alkalaceticus]UNC91884.1 LysM peptidoglycan-binding domain-containing protein [Candidatus Contubernalis alkalaceticus]